jgi:hypothetical protein
MPGSEVKKRIKQNDLGVAAQIRKKVKVFLDTKYWVILRETHLGIRSDKASTELLKSLSQAVQNGIAICPITEDIFYEIAKRKDEESFRLTIQLIDELSSGICLKSYESRLVGEIQRLILTLNFPEKEWHNVEELVWTKISSILGMKIPIIPGVDEKSLLALQIDFFEFIWSVSLSEICQISGFKNLLDNIVQPPDMSTEANTDKTNEFGNMSYNRRQVEEVRVILMREIDAIENVAAFLLDRFPDKFRTHSDDIRLSEQLCIILIAIFYAEKQSTLLPTLDIESRISSEIFVDETRPHKANDYYDAMHACSALPYCDIFLTENDLKSILTKRNPSLAQKYNCRIISNLDEAALVMQNIISAPTR